MGSFLYKSVKVTDHEKVVTTYDSLFQITAEGILGDDILIGDLCKNKKCIIIVNVASE